MKLPTLLTQITPLPYSVCELPHGFRPVIVAHDGEVAIVSGTSGTKQETEANAAYLNHSANLFPELVKALEDLQAVSKHVSDLNHAGNPISNGTWSSLFASVNEAQAILARANEIKV